MPRLDWMTVLTSGLAAAIFSSLISIGADVGYYKPYQRERERLERSRAAASVVLNHSAHLHKKFGALFLLPKIPATASNEGVREQAKTLLILADAVNDACLKQPFVTGPCAEYSAWSTETVPFLERLASPGARPLSALQALPEAKRSLLVGQLDNFIAQLKLGLERE